MLKKFAVSVILFVMLLASSLFASEPRETLQSVSGEGSPLVVESEGCGELDGKDSNDLINALDVIFTFAIPYAKSNLAVACVKVLDKDGCELAIFYPGGEPSDSLRAVMPAEDMRGCWGEPLVSEDGVKYRNINDKTSRFDFSCFVISMPRHFEDGDYILVKYMDVKSDLIPLSIVYNNKFVRMGQIYLEGSGKWNEDLFEIPLAGD